MTAASKHRKSIILAAVKLFRKKGYASTGLNDILAESGAPKGSLYHYFPAGKEQLGEEAVHFAGSITAQTLRALRANHQSAAEVLRAFGALLSGWMEQSSFKDGCPIATTILETVPQSIRISSAGKEAFGLWRAEFESLLVADGTSEDDARRLANLAVAVIEGALIQARVEASPIPLKESIEEVALLMEARARPS
ncbi:MAG TPA: TetR/AcrR family transcriptional regulator [Pseudomonas xinjiangensis]|uniref:TetR/AcrR family transcriptional regulator n=2 Tax=root TaxID=1 RepID=A0A7V1BMG0_9GAMM|nr:TetR/AcrR family transcriptional regulator [Halopseudomonas xinjiangensis]HEC49261.1 TetR/AcrR family transcriptional regulator [Halopseudomonas xinjiangensis]